MNQPWIYMCSPSRSPLPPPSPPDPSGSSQCTRPEQNRLLHSVGEGEGGMFRENSIKTCILSRVKQIASLLHLLKRKMNLSPFLKRLKNMYVGSQIHITHSSISTCCELHLISICMLAAVALLFTNDRLFPLSTSTSQSTPFILTQRKQE